MKKLQPTPAAKPSKQRDELVDVLGFFTLEAKHLRSPELSEQDRERLKEFEPLFGTTETVDVRQVPISRMRQFAQSLDDEARLIELYCQKPNGWADTLTPDSASAIADKGIEINGTFYRAWFLRQTSLREMQKPGAIADLERRLTETIAALQTTTPTPNQSASPSSS